MRWDATRLRGAHREGDGRRGEDVVFRRRLAGLLLDLLAARESADRRRTRRTVDVLPRGRAAAARATYPLAPTSRTTIDAGADAELRQPVVRRARDVRRAGRRRARDVLRHADPLWSGGHDSVGVTAPSTSWFLAEGATGQVLRRRSCCSPIPNATPADVTLTYLPASGVAGDTTKTIPARAAADASTSAIEDAVARERRGRDAGRPRRCRSSSSARSTGRRAAAGTKRTTASA